MRLRAKISQPESAGSVDSKSEAIRREISLPAYAQTGIKFIYPRVFSE
jgi:hypothetical protein